MSLFENPLKRLADFESLEENIKKNPKFDEVDKSAESLVQSLNNEKNVITEIVGYYKNKKYEKDSFEEGKKLDITGVSKGKGTQGNIKRHGHHRGPMTHGSKHKRLAGALAGATYPSRVFPGNAGPGRMGRDTVTVQNVELVKIDTDRNLMLVKGAVPGGKGSLVKVRYAVKGQDK